MEIINPLSCPAWDTLLPSSSGCSFFHTSHWARALNESYGYTPLYFTARDNGSMTTVIPLMEVKSFLTGRRGVALPFTDYCDPVVPGSRHMQGLMECLVEFGKRRGWEYIELRCGHSTGEEAIPSSVYYGHVLSLQINEEKILSGLRDSTKRNIKKAAKSGVEVVIDSSTEAMSEFIQLNCASRRAQGLPPQPDHFFRNIYIRIIAKGYGFIARAVFEKRTIACALYLHFGKKAIYKYGASDKRYQSLRANNLVMWEAIKWYARNGFESLCFGRTEPENSGLLQFKSGWGACKHDIRYYRYDLRKGAFRKNAPQVKGWHKKIFNKMPSPLLRMTGSLLYKHIG